MGNYLSPKIFVATFVGLSLVGGAYIATTFAEVEPATQPAQVATSELIVREPIEVTDSDNNGIEDWRDVFVNNEPVAVPTTSIDTDYVLPETLTGMTSVQLLEGLINSKVYAPIAPQGEAIVEDTMRSVARNLETKVYQSRDISIMSDYTTEDIVNYANALALVIEIYSQPNLRNELEVFQEVVESEDEGAIAELRAISDVYQDYTDKTREIPVPAIFAKEHLDLVNSYQALYEDVEGMSQVLEDPLY